MILIMGIAGNHGWDNKQAVMHPIFIARGPAFKENYVAEPFETVNIYALLCHLLGINPRPNNGTVENVRHILKSDVSKLLYTFYICIIVHCLSRAELASVSPQGTLSSMLS
jgi:hypothetical protein